MTSTTTSSPAAPSHQAASGPQPDSPTSLAGRVPPSLRTVLTVLGFAAPIAGVLVLIAHYGVNLILDDQWDDVTVVQSSYGHFPDWSVLWHPHNQNRLLFPNLIVIALAHLDHLNIVVEELVGAVMLISAYVLLILAHRRWSRTTPWLYYCPVALLGLGIVQWQNLLWGFQMAWFLVLLALAATIFLVDKRDLSWPFVAAGIATATVGSFSSLQGLSIWVAGLVLFFYRRRSARIVVPWIASAVVVVFLYYYHFPSVLGLKPSLAASHPLASLKWVIFELGDVLGQQYPANVHKPINWWVFLFGLALVCLGILSIISMCRLRRDTESGRPIGVALMVVAALFSLMVLQGRFLLGYWGASQSRYTTCTLLLPVGIYFIVIGRIGQTGIGEAAPDRVPSGLRRAIGAATAVLMVIAFAVGTYKGQQAAEADHRYALLAASIERHWQTKPKEVGVLYFFRPDSYIRHQARIAQQLHLSVFAP